MINQQEAVAKVPAERNLQPLGGLLLAAMTAWSALVTNGQIKAGQTVLIPGGSGSLGQLAIPMTKQLGLTVAVSGNQRGQAGPCG